jgi:6-pyruvoyltetrahydropterin/6-carboxytetrahydropterin synthase
MNVTVCRKAHFNAAHRLYSPNWTDERNQEIFGKCANPNFHGHNYELIVHLTGPIQEETGYVYDLKVLADLIDAQVIKRYDHRNLNLDVEEFKHKNPTAEYIAVEIWQRLRPHLEAHLTLAVTLYETERNFVIYHGQ